VQREIDLLNKVAPAPKVAPVLPPPVVIPKAPTGTLMLDKAIDIYLANSAKKSGRTVSAYAYCMKEFFRVIGNKPLASIAQQDLIDFVGAMRTEGLADRTIHNRIAEVVGLLRSNGMKEVKLRVRFTEKKIRAYTHEELRGLFTVCNPEDRLVFEFFLGSGCREQEVSHACWDDVNFEAKTYTVREHLEIGFVPKDREEREVPLPDALVAALQLRRLAHPGTKLIFPNKQGRPEGHFLRRLQNVAKDAGLAGKYELHKFRKSFASIHHEAGVSARTLQMWLGHSELETTLAYLEAADMRSERTREQVNHSFAAFA
jgi:integrase